MEQARLEHVRFLVNTRTFEFVIHKSSHRFNLYNVEFLRTTFNKQNDKYQQKIFIFPYFFHKLEYYLGLYETATLGARLDVWTYSLYSENAGTQPKGGNRRREKYV
jgi:hypothetical protein